MSENASLSNMILRSAGIYSDEQLERISTNRAANPGMGLAEAAVKFGGSREVDFLKAVGRVLGMDYVDLESQQPAPDALTRLPASAVYQYNVLPFRFDGQVMTIVASDPFDTRASDGLRLVLGCPVKTALAPKDPVLVDMLRGGVYSVSSFAKLPLVDYPLILADRSQVPLADCAVK